MGSCHGMVRVLMAITQWRHSQENLGTNGNSSFVVSVCWGNKKIHESHVLRQVDPSSWAVSWKPLCVLTSRSELVNTKCAKKKKPNKTGAGIQRTRLNWERTWWSPGGELRWAEYHFVNVPLEVFSLSCINLSILPVPVELGDAFVLRHSSDLPSTAALFTPFTSSPTAFLHLNTKLRVQLGTKQSTSTRIYINSDGFRGKTNSSIYFFIIYLFIHTIFVHRRVAVKWMTVLLAGNTKICETNTNKLFTFNSFAPWINTWWDSYIFTTKNSSFYFSSNLLIGEKYFAP